MFDAKYVNLDCTFGKKKKLWSWNVYAIFNDAAWSVVDSSSSSGGSCPMRWKCPPSQFHTRKLSFAHKEWVGSGEDGLASCTVKTTSLRYITEVKPKTSTNQSTLTERNVLTNTIPTAFPVTDIDLKRTCRRTVTSCQSSNVRKVDC